MKCQSAAVGGTVTARFGALARTRRRADKNIQAEIGCFRLSG